MPGRGSHLFLLAAIGCSSPSVATKRDVVAPTARGSAAAAATRQESRTPPVLSSEPTPLSNQQQARHQPYTFEWEQVRKKWEKAPSEFPCEVCRMGPPTGGWCCLPGGKPMRAAKVTIWRIVDATHTWLDLDLGSEALIMKDWYAALIDEQGHPITEWVQLQYVGRDNSEVIVPVGYEKIDRASSRVALVAERPQ